MRHVPRRPSATVTKTARKAAVRGPTGEKKNGRFMILVGGRSVRQRRCGKHRMGRALKGVGRKHHDEIDAERAPLDGAQVGDFRLDSASEDIDRDGIAYLEAQSPGEVAFERHERGTV